MAADTTTGKNKDIKKDAGTNTAPKEKTSGQDVASPKGPTREEILAMHRKKAESKEKVTSDVVGYYNSDGEFPITGVPESGVIAIDSGIDKTKPSLLMKWKVTVPTEIADSDGNMDICKAGDLVGVWYKPGMRDVRSLGGVEVTMSRDPKRDKDTGKGNPMKAFAIFATGVGRPLQITEDRREKSRGAQTVFDLVQAAPDPTRVPKAAPAVYGEDDSLPF